MANLIPKIAKMLGVELGEEFKIDIRSNDIFQITESGIWMKKDVNKDEWVEMPFEFMMLCNGDANIVKLNALNRALQEKTATCCKNLL